MNISPVGLVSAVKAKIPMFNRNKSGSHMRAHARHGACLMGEILIPEKSYKLEGLIIELSRGGVRFREASSYILNRLNLVVVVQVGGLDLPGKIVNVGANGYGIKLDELMPEAELDRLLAMGKPAQVPTQDQAVTADQGEPH